MSLLVKLGYRMKRTRDGDEREFWRVSHPENRRLVFVGSFLAGRGDFVIDAPFIIHFGIDLFVAFANESGFDHAAQRTVKRPRSHLDLPLRIGFDLLHDAVAVSLVFGKCEKDMQNRWSQGRIGFVGCHEKTLYPQRI